MDTAMRTMPSPSTYARSITGHWSAVVDTVAGVNSHGSQRVFDRDTARAVLVMAVRHWGHALASIPVREEA
jgi:hypothetical protein